MLISKTWSGIPNCLLASPFSEQSGISLAVRNTLAPVPPATVPLIGSYAPGESNLSLSLSGSN